MTLPLKWPASQRLERLPPPEHGLPRQAHLVPAPAHRLFQRDLTKPRNCNAWPNSRTQRSPSIPVFATEATELTNRLQKETGSWRRRTWRVSAQ